MSEHLKFGEKPYLLTMARRLLNLSRKAAAQGEEYHDLQPPTDLQCGYAAKMRFVEKTDGQWTPQVTVGPAKVGAAIELSDEGRQQVASEILDGKEVVEISRDGSNTTFGLKDP